MALKDWRKKRTRFSNEILWESKARGALILIINERDSSEESRRGFWLTSNVDDKYYSGIKFSSIAEAINAAKQIMRTH